MKRVYGIYYESFLFSTAHETGIIDFLDLLNRVTGLGNSWTIASWRDQIHNQSSNSPFHFYSICIISGISGNGDPVYRTPYSELLYCCHFKSGMRLRLGFGWNVTGTCKL